MCKNTVFFLCNVAPGQPAWEHSRGPKIGSNKEEGPNRKRTRPQKQNPSKRCEGCSKSQVLVTVMGPLWVLSNAHFQSSVMDRLKRASPVQNPCLFSMRMAHGGRVRNHGSAHHPLRETPYSTLRRFELHSRDSKLSALFPSPEEAWNGKSENGQRKA